MTSILSACSHADIWMPFSSYSISDRSTLGRTSLIDKNDYDNRIEGFSDNLCVFKDDVAINDIVMENCASALLIDIETNNVVYAKNAFIQRTPASITKLLTAYVAVKYLSLDTVITCTESVENITVSGAVLLGLKKGDSMTLDQALHMMLLSSYNDVALAIAETVSGSEEEFCKLMTEEALALGCTNSNFISSSGLIENNHYTTSYELYLIFNEVINTPSLLEILQCKEYTSTINRSNGGTYEVTSQTTNMYLRGYYECPANINIIGGKTGTTDMAGHCLMMLVRNKNSKPYIAIVLGCDTTDDLYTEMTSLLSLCE